MKTFFLVAVSITIAAASNGYYHQEYNYKTSASSYKNNELQHKTDDQGYYSKDGDLEGRVRPKIKSNSEHSEYVNPNLGPGGNDASSHGNLLANSYGASVGGQIASGYNIGSRSQYENALESEGLASSNHIGGVSSGYSSGTSHQYGSGSSYEARNLQAIGSRLQNDLQQEFQSLVKQSHLDIESLESELRRNLTSRLNEILQERFGTQVIKGGQAYSLNEGRLQTRPNYDQMELDQMQKQIERSLLNDLRQKYSYKMSHSGHQTVNQQGYKYYESTTTLRPYISRPIYPNLLATTPVDKYTVHGGTKNSQYSSTNSENTYSTQYVQAPNVASITVLASNVQQQLNNQLNRILEDVQRQYFTDSSRYTTINTGPILDRLKEDLRQNLTYAFDEELGRTFGNQMERNGYMFSSGQSSQYNYHVADLRSLKKQVEDNLLNKLTKDFEAARQHSIKRQQHASQTQQAAYSQYQESEYSYGNNQIYSTPRYTEYHRPATSRYVDEFYPARTSSPSLVNLIGSNIKGGQQYGSSGSHIASGNFEASGNIHQAQQQLQSQLSNQLQAALSQNRAHLSGYSSSSSQTAFDEAYQRLYEELQRNLTSQLQDFLSGSSGYSSGYGFNQEQLSQLRSQLQKDLVSQLQHGLQQSYSVSASYSASAGSSSSAGAGSYSSSNSGDYYRPVRGSDNYYQHGNMVAGRKYYGEECEPGEDLYSHQLHRIRRSYGYLSRPVGLSTHAGTGYNSRGTYGSTSSHGSNSVGQEQDDTELVQSGYGYGSSYGQAAASFGGQQIDNTEDTQQILDPEFEKLESRYPTSGSQVELGQEIDNSEDTQQIINPRLDWNSQGATHGQIGQMEDNSDDTQQVEVDRGFSTIGLGSQSRYQGTANLGVGTNLSQNLPSGQRPLYSQAVSGQRRLNQGGETVEINRTGSNVQPSLYSPPFTSNSATTNTTQLLQSNQKPLYSGSQYAQTTQRFPVYGGQVGQIEDDSDDTQQIIDQGYGDIFNENRRNASPSSSTLTNSIGSSHYIDRQKLESNDKLRQLNRRPNSGYEDGGSYAYYGQAAANSDDVQQVQSPFETNFNVREPLTPDGDRNQPSSTQRVTFIQSTERPIAPQNSYGQREINRNDRVYQTNSNRPGSLESQSQLGQETDDSELVQLVQVRPNSQKTDDNPEITRPVQVSHFLYGQTTDNRSSSGSSSNQEFGNSSYNWKPSSRPTTFNIYNQQTSSTSTTTKNPLLLQFGTQNVLPDDESIEPLPSQNTYPSSNVPISQSTGSLGTILKNPTLGNSLGQVAQNNFNEKIPISQSGVIAPGTPASTPIPSNSNYYLTRPTAPSVSLPPQLVRVSEQLETKLTSQIDEAIRNKASSTLSSVEIYQDTLRKLKENIVRECQRLLYDRSYSYLQIQQSDVTLLKQYIESHLIKKLDEKFFNTGAVVDVSSSTYQPTYPNNNYGLNRDSGRFYTPKPQISSNTFLQGEVNSQYNPYQPIGYGPMNANRPNLIGSDSLVKPPTTSPVKNLIDSENGLPLPTLKPFTPLELTPQESVPQPNVYRKALSDAENEADALIERLRNKMTTSTTRPSEFNQPQVIQVKLENITPEQFAVINNVETDFSSIVDISVQNEFAAKSFDHASRYTLYQRSLNKLESELKRNLTECFTGTLSQESNLARLNKYSNLIYEKFNVKTVPDVKKYIEIRLVKKLRALLKIVYNIETTEITDSQRSPQVPISYQPEPGETRRNQVKLEGITAEQLKVIQRMEDDINRNIEASIQIAISNLNEKHLSDYQYQQSLEALKQELYNNITATVQRLCEPGFQQYHELRASKFDLRKLNDLEKYLQIKLSNKLGENIKYYSTTSSSRSYHSSQSFQYSGGHSQNSYQTYNRYDRDGHSGSVGAVPQETILSGPSQAEIPRVSSTSFVNNGYVKGGNKHGASPYVVGSSNPSSIEPDSESIETTVNPNAEPTTAESWWARFGNKVKKEAHKLKEKITGKS
ncbi:uncharacterized protein [Euwallacea fornicatus]|uniref:uncharacterized protein isoform X2 n=1 Tax=Euwallacea fornicatus TaxID=995702 RepID=UPI00338F0F06